MRQTWQKGHSVKHCDLKHRCCLPTNTERPIKHKVHTLPECRRADINAFFTNVPGCLTVILECHMCNEHLVFICPFIHEVTKCVISLDLMQTSYKHYCTHDEFKIHQGFTNYNLKELHQWLRPAERKQHCSGLKSVFYLHYLVLIWMKQRGCHTHSCRLDMKRIQTSYSRL